MGIEPTDRQNGRLLSKQVRLTQRACHFLDWRRVRGSNPCPPIDSRGSVPLEQHASCTDALLAQHARCMEEDGGVEPLRVNAPTVFYTACQPSRRRLPECWSEWLDSNQRQPASKAGMRPQHLTQTNGTGRRFCPVVLGSTTRYSTIELYRSDVLRGRLFTKSAGRSQMIEHGVNVSTTD